MVPSARARALIEALHEPSSNEERWEIAGRFLGEAYEMGREEGRAERGAELLQTVGGWSSER